MNIVEFQNNYFICDGKLKKIRILPEQYTSESFIEANVEVLLEVRDAKSNNWVTVTLTFKGNVWLSIYDDNLSASSEYYSDITLTQRENGRYYLSLDPCGNTHLPDQNDNNIIESDELEILL